MQHLIKKQVFELTLDKWLNHFHTQQLVSEHYWNNIVPLLEKIFDKAGSDEEVIQLDKLEIDLGVLSEKSIQKNEWGILLQSKIEELLTVMLHTTSTVKKIKYQPKRLNTFGQWLFYMQHGYLPWNAINIDEKWYQLVLEALAVDFESVQTLRNVIKRDVRVLKRIIYQHDVHFLLTLSEVFTAEKQSELSVIINELTLLKKFIQEKEITHHSKTAKEITKELWQQAIQLSVEAKENRSGKKIAHQLVALFVMEQQVNYKLAKAITIQLPVSLSLITAEIKNLSNSKQVESKVLPKLRKVSKKTEKDTKTKETKSDGENSIQQRQSNASSLNDVSTQLIVVQKDINYTELHTSIADAIDEEGIFVANAGVVLLHPFLPTLFKRLNLLDKGSFISDMLHQKALYLLHYLATGSTAAEEHELLIAKVVCDTPEEMVVEKNIDIPSSELEELDDMIIAAIQQWDKLKNSSVAALREGFLQRNGKLLKKNNCLYLQVEKSAIDILLDYLPWNLSMIKLPWMKEILRVEWR